MKKIVYYGMGFLPDKNAVANRELVFAKMIRTLGYRPVLIGISRTVPCGQYERFMLDDIECYEVMYPDTLSQKFWDNFYFSQTLISIFNEIGIENIKCFIMQDYQVGPMKKLLKFCKKNDIKFIPDIMDWFTPTSDSSIVKNIVKTIDTFCRMYYFYPKLEYRLCISHTFKRHFEKYHGKNVVIPCTSLSDNIKSYSESRLPLRLVFAGNPGVHLEKEKLGWVIKSLYENNSNMELYIIGIDYDTCVRNNPDIIPFITSNIQFKGNITHDECIRLLKECDFSIIVRKKNKLSTYGFSSKICEAFAHGVPVLATNVGDNSKYIENGKTGFICECNYNAVKEMLNEVERLDISVIKKMKMNLIKDNPLSDAKFFNEFKILVEEK